MTKIGKVGYTVHDDGVITFDSSSSDDCYSMDGSTDSMICDVEHIQMEVMDGLHGSLLRLPQMSPGSNAHPKLVFSVNKEQLNSNLQSQTVEILYQMLNYIGEPAIVQQKRRTKQQCVEAMLYRMDCYQDNGLYSQYFSTVYNQVLSIDVGQKNLAVVQYDVKSRKISDWELIEVNLSQYNCHQNEALVKYVDSFINTYAIDKLSIVLIERQRSATNKYMTRSKVACANLQFQTVLMAMLHRKCRVVDVDPQLVRLNNFPMSDHGPSSIKRAKLTYSQKKKQAVALTYVLAKIAGHDQFLRALQHVKKKDDLCDAWLQLMTFIRWEQKVLDYIKCVAERNK